MILPILFMILAPPVEAKLPALNDAQKLSVREAQVEVLALQNAQSELKERLDKALDKLNKAIDAAKKVCGGELSNDLSCVAPAQKAEPKKTDVK